MSDEKTYWSSTSMTFLSFLLDTVNQIIGIPLDKVAKGLNMIGNILSKLEKLRAKRKMTVLQLQKICRTFTRRFYAQLEGLSHLKPHHHIRITDEVFNNLKIWKLFLSQPSVYSRSFLDLSTTHTADQLLFFTDASKNFSLGFGGFCGTHWMHERWIDVGIDSSLDPSITYLELYALTAGVLPWIHNFSNKKVAIFCDNTSVVSMVNSSTSKCKNFMMLLRLVVLECSVHNVHLRAIYVITMSNKTADSLSHFQEFRFRKLTQGMHMDTEKMTVPAQLTPANELWLC